MKLPYQDAVIVVTGASTGLGRAIAVGAVEQGALLWLIGVPIPVILLLWLFFR